jgi:nucleotide-binding universal stress UspA family protein
MIPLRTIAVGFDGSPDAEAAARWAFDLAHRVGAEVVVVHAVGLLEHAGHLEVAAEFEATVRDLIGEVGLDPNRVRWQNSDGDPCSVLLRATEAPVAADVVVVGSRGQGSHAEHLLGSTSHELAEHTLVPLVIVPRGGESTVS